MGFSLFRFHQFIYTSFILNQCFIISIKSQNYSRESLQTEYPGFGTKWIPMLQDNGEVKIGYFDNPEGDEEARISLSPDPDTVVRFILYTREERNGTRVKHFKEIQNFDKNKPIKFVTHGWMAGGDGKTCTRLKDSFLHKYDANVFVVDWKDIADNIFYPIPMRATTGVGEIYARFLNEMIDTGIDPKNIHLVGHSLGAHVSGYAAKGTKSAKIGRVTGLDPALPGFDLGLIEGGHVAKNDALFVDIIHTCAGFLGMGTPVGDADFYPNGGNPPQPGCGGINSFVETCSHGRSWLYFAESLTAPVPFMAYKCDSFASFDGNNGCEKEGVPMGDPTPTTAKGTFYLKTEPEPPFILKSQVDQYLEREDNQI